MSRCSRRRHPLVERRHFTLLHMAPSQHRLIKRVPLPLPLTAAQAPHQWLDGAAHLGAGDGPQRGHTLSTALPCRLLSSRSRIPPPMAELRVTGRPWRVHRAAIVLHRQGGDRLQGHPLAALLDGPTYLGASLLHWAIISANPTPSYFCTSPSAPSTSSCVR